MLEKLLQRTGQLLADHPLHRRDMARESFSPPSYPSRLEAARSPPRRLVCCPLAGAYLGIDLEFAERRARTFPAGTARKLHRVHDDEGAVLLIVAFALVNNADIQSWCSTQGRWCQRAGRRSRSAGCRGLGGAVPLDGRLERRP